MKTILTAAATALALATPAAAYNAPEGIGIQPVCELLTAVGRTAMTARQAGMSQQSAARIIGEKIGEGFSQVNGSQQIASLMGSYSTFILQIAYSVPIERTQTERDIAVLAMQSVVYERCMGY